MRLILSEPYYRRRNTYGRVDSALDSQARWPGFTTRRVRYSFYWATHWMSSRQHRSRTFTSCVEGLERISRSGQTKNIKWVVVVSSVTLQHQWIAQAYVDPVSLVCDGTRCHVLCLENDIPMWQHNVPLLQSGTDAIWCLKATLSPNKHWNAMNDVNDVNMQVSYQVVVSGLVVLI